MARGVPREMSRYQYGSTALWVLERSIGGSRALRLGEQVDLFFGEGGHSLLLDLRSAGFIDSIGAETMERAAGRHPSFGIVGLPRGYHALPRAVRGTLRMLRPGVNLSAAFTSLNGSGGEEKYREKRRHRRIPASLHIEIILGNRSAAAILHDVSLGGGRIGRLPAGWISEIEDMSRAPSITIAGLDLDPLGREIAGSYETSMLPSRPVHLLPDSTGLGVSFSDTSKEEPE